jgi:predicted Zn-dependent protease
MGSLAFDLLFAHKFEKSLDASDRAVTAAPGLIWLLINRAHALMFLGRVKEARALYLAHLGEKTDSDNLWEVEVRTDFTEFRNAGLSPLMDEIEKIFDQAK